MSSSTGHLKLYHVTEEREDDGEDSKPTPVANKSKTSSINSKRPFKKAQSDFVLTQSKSQIKTGNGVNPSLRKKLERQSSKK